VTSSTLQIKISSTSKTELPQYGLNIVESGITHHKPNHLQNS